MGESARKHVRDSSDGVVYDEGHAPECVRVAVASKDLKARKVQSAGWFQSSFGDSKYIYVVVVEEV